MKKQAGCLVVIRLQCKEKHCWNCNCVKVSRCILFDEDLVYDEKADDFRRLVICKRSEVQGEKVGNFMADVRYTFNCYVGKSRRM
jgi:hypothetical protein